MPDVLEGLDFYDRPTPYDVIGVSPDAEAKDIRDRYAGLQRDMAMRGEAAETRAREKERLDAAYNQIRVAAGRIRVDFFLLDSHLALRQAETVAKEVAKPDLDVAGVLKSRQPTVKFTAILSESKAFFGDPGRVVGMFARPMELEQATTGVLPELLMPQFDC